MERPEVNNADVADEGVAAGGDRGDNANVGVGRVAVRLPQYFSNAAWNVQVESAFHISGVTSQITKYHHLVSSLPPTVLQQISDKLDATGPNPYDRIMEVILVRMNPSKSNTLSDLFNSQADLGDQKPSTLLRVMRQQLRSVQPMADPEQDQLLRWAFMQKLPISCRQILAGQGPTATLSSVAEIADSIMDARPTIAGIFPVVDDESVNVVRSHKQGRVGPTQRSFAGGLCVYHTRAGFDATQCVQPCTWEPTRVARGFSSVSKN